MTKLFEDIARTINKQNAMCIMLLDRELGKLFKSALFTPIDKNGYEYNFLLSLYNEIKEISENDMDKKEVFSEKKNFIVITYKENKYQYQYINGTEFLPNKEQLQAIRKYNRKDKIKYGIYKSR